MKALITAGGRATRLRPITHTINKHLIPIAGKPMLFYAIEKVVGAGINEIGIIINPGEQEIPRVVGDGSRFGARVSYIEQQGGPLGIAHAVNMARGFLGDEPFMFYLGDNIILGDLKRFRDKFENENLNCLLALSLARGLSRFGVPEMKDGRIIRVDEKPENPKSQYAVTGIYIYDKNFFDAFSRIAPSGRGEYEISDIHTLLINDGFNVGYEVITGWWKDTGRPEDLLEGNQLVLSEFASRDVANNGDTHNDARIQGRVKVGKGTKIGPNVLIRGPVVIGDDCVIEDSYIGPYTSIGDRVVIHGAEIEHSIIFDEAEISCPRRIVDSILGFKARVSNLNDSFPQGHKLIVGDHAVVEL